ncbi:LysR substrate-binding domain-containing protein [Limibacillus sp. MBR-115]|uniref:LysR family transcriptional regulator n=1 Tax=Limibacillus sp. MBR-115 TaxID=3156465 RepID=UPI00339B0205
MIETRHLRAFHAVAEELSFRKAAQRLNVAQPALSRTIQDLEMMMHVRLLERTTRVVNLTEPGKVFLKKTRGLMQSLEEAVHLARQVHEGTAGELHVGYNDFAINGHLPEIVRRFRNAHPKINVTVVDPTTPEMIDFVLDGKLDAVFIMDTHHHPALDHIVVRDERMVCVLPASHPLSEKRSLSLSDLADQPFIMGKWSSWKLFRRVIKNFCQSYGFTPQVIQEAVHSDGIIGLVAAELGVTLYVDTDWIHSVRGIAVRPLKGGVPKIETVAAWRRDRRTDGSALSSFLDVTESVVKQKGVHFSAAKSTGFVKAKRIEADKAAL